MVCWRCDDCYHVFKSVICICGSSHNFVVAITCLWLQLRVCGSVTCVWLQLRVCGFVTCFWFVSCIWRLTVVANMCLWMLLRVCDCYYVFVVAITYIWRLFVIANMYLWLLFGFLCFFYMLMVASVINMFLRLFNEPIKHYYYQW